MLKESFGTGATLDEAKEAALKALGAPEDADVKYEVVERPKAKVLGLFGGSPAKMRAYYEYCDYKEDPFSKTKEYLRFIFKYLGVEKAEINMEENDEEFKITVNCGNDYGSVVGRRGETLDALQYLARLVANKGSEKYKRASINVGDYREKRENVLTALARRKASKVRKYGGVAVLEPMNPYERRIIHMAVQDIEGVSSHSVGADASRRVVITLSEGFKPLRASGGGYKGKSGGGNGNYDRGSDYTRGGGYKRGGRPYGSGPKSDARRGDSRAPSAPPISPRTPRSDSASASLYGKIEVDNNTN